MQFFEHQDQARGRTSLLLGLFSISVLGLGAAAALGTHLFLSSGQKPGEELAEYHWSLVATAAVTTWGVILFGSLFRMAQLRGGGEKVAETMGGTLLSAGTQEPLERRAINIVEEMAIAAGLPVPPVYLMRSESGINAFAAGWSPDDAVIGITQGALESLSRDQLQGVIAHEFSHILNRDCALNMRLIGVLYGIVVLSIIGRFLFHLGTGSRHTSTRKEGGAIQFLVIGGAIWLFGSVGVLIARFIQSAVSQQREYLADASAVQFTRNPQGIAGALATIACQSSTVANPRSSETSHMLIAEPGSTSFLSVLSSHPPVFERIQRIIPSWSGGFDELATPAGSVRARLKEKEERARSSREVSAQDSVTGGFPGVVNLPGVPQPAQAVLEGALILDQVSPSESPSPVTSPQTSSPQQPALSQAGQLLASMPPALREAAEDAFSTRALILAWILDRDAAVHDAQMALLGSDPPLASETERLFRLMPKLEPQAILPLFDIALGTLAALSEPQKNRFLSVLEALEAQLSDRAYRSYCLAALAMRHLDPRGKKHKVKPLLIKDAIETMLGVLAVQGHDSLSEAQEAFTRGRERLGKRGSSLSLPPPQRLSIHRLSSAFATLLRLPNSTRSELLDAAEFIAAADGELRQSEAELLRTMATCLGIAAHGPVATS